MAFDRVVFHRGEGILLTHDQVSYANLADIMEFSGSLDLITLPLAQPHLPGDPYRITASSARMAHGIGIFGTHCVHQSNDDLVISLLDLLVKQGVLDGNRRLVGQS